MLFISYYTVFLKVLYLDLLFSFLYATSLGTVISKSCVHHLCADDMQLVISFASSEFHNW